MLPATKDIYSITTETISNSIAAIEGFTKNLGIFQSELLFNIKLIKEQKLKNLDGKRINRVVTEARWRHLIEDQYNVDYIESDFFHNCHTVPAEKHGYLENSVLILSNHSPMQGDSGEGKLLTLLNFVNLCLSLENTLIVGWDWDNHHQIQTASIISAASDVYLPSHFANDFELSASCEHKKRIPSSSHQWSRKFLVENLNLILRRDRIHDVIGRHVAYSAFPLRNNILMTLNGQNRNICLIDSLDDYLKKSSLEKLEEWTRYKCHWIVPTLNDVSTRVFDALITGGIIIIPARFKYDEVFAGLNENDCVYYDNHDVLDCSRAIEQALRKFDEGGADGVLRRFRHALDHHNLDTRFGQILDFVTDNFPVGDGMKAIRSKQA